MTLGPAFRCVTRSIILKKKYSSGVCERDYAKPQLPLGPAEAPLAIGQKSIPTNELPKRYVGSTVTL